MVGLHQNYRRASSHCADLTAVESWRAGASIEMEGFFLFYDESEKPDWFWRIMQFCAAEFDQPRQNLAVENTSMPAEPQIYRL